MCVGELHDDPKYRLQRCLNFSALTVACLGYRDVITDHVSGTLSGLGRRAVGEMVTERDLCTMLHNMVARLYI